MVNLSTMRWRARLEKTEPEKRIQSNEDTTCTCAREIERYRQREKHE